MFVTAVNIDGYKNLCDVSIKPDSRYNIIVGKNAQGKTNILEAIWLMSGCKSFRGSRERDYLGFNRDNLNIELSFMDTRREQKITYAMVRNSIRDKKITLNGVPLSSTSSLFENFKCVLFTPDDTNNLVKGAPEKRRTFIDMCYSQLKPSSLNYIRRYDTLINQRNAVIKAIQGGSDTVDSLLVWDEQIALNGAYISFMRHKYINKLCEYCENLYSRITDGKEKFSIDYVSNVYGSEFSYPEKPDSNMVSVYYDKLRNGINDDLRYGYTLVGANRDDISLKINGLTVREYGSQGQQKSAALVLKLSQAGIYYKDRKESPIILLDDVMGELDVNRQNLVYEIVSDMQVFITTCNENAVIGHEKGSILHIENGKAV